MNVTEYLTLEAALPPYDKRTEEQQNALTAAYKMLPSKERHQANRARVDAYFVPENRSGKSDEHLSPSGRYKLVITGYSTRPGAWTYARGEVYRVSDGQLVGDVKRNYVAFPHAWVEDHPKGDFLVCGEDYQGQTVIDLTSGRRRDELPEAAEKGHGFCWAVVTTTPDKTLLFVDGCLWACPYEHRIYDFTDPIEEGWPEVACEDIGLYSEDNSKLTMEGDQFVYVENQRVFLATGERSDDIDRKHSDLFHEKSKAEKKGDTEAVEAAKAAMAAHDAAYPDEDGDTEKWGLTPDHKVILRREGAKLIVVDEWKSEHVLDSERRRVEYDTKWKADSTRYRAEDPFYQWFITKVGDTEKALQQTHFTIPSINMRDEGDTNPAYFHVSTQEYQESRWRTARLEWGVTYGDVKLDLWTRGKGNVSSTFPRTLDGFLAAWAASEAHTEGGAA